MNKITSYSGVVIVTFFLASCNAYFDASSSDVYADMEKERLVDVMKIQTSSDELVYFSEKYPGKLYNGEVMGVRHVPLQFFAADSVVYRIRGSKEIPLYVFSNGRKFDIYNQDKINLVYTSSVIQIPYSEISNIQFKKNGNNPLVISGLIVSLSALSIFIISNMSINAVDTF